MEHWNPKQSQELADLRLLSEYCTDVIARVTPDMVFSYISPSAERLFRRPVSDTLGHLVQEFVVPDDWSIISEATRRLRSGEIESAVVTVRAIRGDGTLLWVEVTSRPIGDFSLGNPGDRAVVMRDVTERKALEDSLRFQASVDGLTGLLNRRAFDEALAAVWEKALHEGSEMSLLLLDVDYFKAFNDAYGHLIGDDCLRAVAKVLQQLSWTGSDVLSRYGGEEFAIILGEARLPRANSIAETVLGAVRSLSIPHQKSALAEKVVTASAGVATVLACRGGSVEMPQALVATADRQLYAAKDSGRNTYRSTILMAQAT